MTNYHNGPQWTTDTYRNSDTRYSGGAGKLTYGAFFDKSTKFGTEVDQHIVITFGGGATAELPPGGRGGL